MPADTAGAANTPRLASELEQPSSLKMDLQPPPFSEINEGPEYSNTSVTLELNTSARTKGKLLQFDVAAEVISILEPRATLPTDIDMSTIKFMRLEKPYQLVLNDAHIEESHPGIDVETDARTFEVYFKDRTEITGKTYGSRNDKNGIHFYEQTKVGRKWRYCTHLFVSTAAIESNVIGGQIGDMLVQEKQISQDALNTALQDQQNERSRLIGDYLVNQKIVDADELEGALSRQKHMPNMRLGEILLTEDLVTEAQLAEALKAQKKKRKGALGEILVSHGVIEKNEIQQCLAKKLGIPFVNLREFIVEPEVIRMITAAIAFKHKVVPLYKFEGKVVVAIENPMDWQVTDALSFNINKYVEPVMASPEDINWALQFYYSSEDIEQTITDFDEEIEEEDESYDASIFSAVETTQVTDNVVVRIVNKIIEDAHRQKVSDIHIEPGMDKMKVIVRFRKDGLLVGGILQGQQLIESSRVKAAIRDMNSTSAAVFSYEDRYGATPGDDGPIAALTARGGDWASVTAGDNDVNLEVILAATFSGVTESGAFWQQFKSSGFLSGNPADTLAAALPTNAWGCVFGVTTALMGNGMAGTKVCASQVPGVSAIAMDIELDDGLGATGSVRATLGVSGTDTDPTNVVLAAAYSEDNVYTVCYQM